MCVLVVIYYTHETFSILNRIKIKNILELLYTTHENMKFFPNTKKIKE